MSQFKAFFEKSGCTTIQKFRVFCKCLYLVHLGKHTKLLGNGLEWMTGSQGKNWSRIGYLRMLKIHLRSFSIK